MSYEFISRAKSIHGDRYGYDDCCERGCREKVAITCKIHGNFLQLPSNHLKGCGCPMCATDRMVKTRTWSNEDWVVKARAKHGDLYDYSKTKYIRSTQKVSIICQTHGPFLQRAQDHIKGHGCELCARQNRVKWTAGAFEAEANRIHNSKYLYDSAAYVPNCKIPITCSRHGVFYITPNSHMAGSGCTQCGYKRSSRAAVEWLDAIAQLEKATIQHADNGKEFSVPGTRYRADGYAADLNKIYEFNGDYYHGNPRKYSGEVYNKRMKKTMGELVEGTERKAEEIRLRGYDYEEIWEDEWNVVKDLSKMQHEAQNGISSDDIEAAHTLLSLKMC